MAWKPDYWVPGISRSRLRLCCQAVKLDSLVFVFPELSMNCDGMVLDKDSHCVHLLINDNMPYCYAVGSARWLY